MVFPNRRITSLSEILLSDQWVCKMYVCKIFPFLPDSYKYLHLNYKTKLKGGKLNSIDLSYHYNVKLKLWDSCELISITFCIWFPWIHNTGIKMQPLYIPTKKMYQQFRITFKTIFKFNFQLILKTHLSCVMFC